MSPRLRTFAALMLAAGLCGCVQSRQAASDDKLTAERLAAMDEALMRAQQDSWSNGRPQPVEDPWHAGRPLEEGK